MTTHLLFKSVYQTVNSIVPKILSVNSIQSVLTHRIHDMCDRQRLNNSLSNPGRNASAFLQPTILPIYNSVCGMKTKGRLQLRCKDCYFVWRRERKYVMCKTYPRHKQALMKKKDYKTWIITSASQSKIRGW